MSIVSASKAFNMLCDIVLSWLAACLRGILILLIVADLLAFCRTIFSMFSITLNSTFPKLNYWFTSKTIYSPFQSTCFHVLLQRSLGTWVLWLTTNHPCTNRLCCLSPCTASDKLQHVTPLPEQGTGFSRLDDCNAVLTGLPACAVKPLQMLFASKHLCWPIKWSQLHSFTKLFQWTPPSFVKPTC